MNTINVKGKEKVEKKTGLVPNLISCLYDILLANLSPGATLPPLCLTQGDVVLNKIVTNPARSLVLTQSDFFMRRHNQITLTQEDNL